MDIASEVMSHDSGSGRSQTGSSSPVQQPRRSFIAAWTIAQFLTPLAFLGVLFALSYYLRIAGIVITSEERAQIRFLIAPSATISPLPGVPGKFQLAIGGNYNLLLGSVVAGSAWFVFALEVILVRVYLGLHVWRWLVMMGGLRAVLGLAIDSHMWLNPIVAMGASLSVIGTLSAILSVLVVPAVTAGVQMAALRPIIRLPLWWVPLIIGAGVLGSLGAFLTYWGLDSIGLVRDNRFEVFLATRSYPGPFDSLQVSTFVPRAVELGVEGLVMATALVMLLRRRSVPTQVPSLQPAAQ